VKARDKITSAGGYYHQGTGKKGVGNIRRRKLPLSHTKGRGKKSSAKEKQSKEEDQFQRAENVLEGTSRDFTERNVASNLTKKNLAEWKHI